MSDSRVRSGAAMLFAALMVAATSASAQTGVLSGAVRDQTGGALPGVTVELSTARDVARSTETDTSGRYRFENVAAGTYNLVFRLLNFGEQQRRNVIVGAGQTVTVDSVLSL